MSHASGSVGGCCKAPLWQCCLDDPERAKWIALTLVLAWLGLIAGISLFTVDQGRIFEEQQAKDPRNNMPVHLVGLWLLVIVIVVTGSVLFCCYRDFFCCLQRKQQAAGDGLRDFSRA